jgi:integrase
MNTTTRSLPKTTLKGTEKQSISNTDALFQARAQREAREALNRANGHLLTRRLLTFKDVVDAYIASRAGSDDASTLSRLYFWCEVMGDKVLTEVDEDDIRDGLNALRIRGAMGFKRGQGVVPLGKPISDATLDRYVTAVGSIYRYARKQELTKKAFIPPIRGFEKKAPVRRKISDDLFVSAEQLEQLVAIAKVVDRRWGRLPALLRVAFVTGLRRGALEQLTWDQLDLKAGTVSIQRTKNDDPIMLPLTDSAIAELKRLGGSRGTGALVFQAVKRPDRPYSFSKLWMKVLAEAGISYRKFHSLRHGTGSALAKAGANQKTIMDVLGHASLASSQVYMHLNLQDRERAVRSTFK